MDKRRIFESLPNVTACKSTLIFMRTYVWSSFQIISIGLNGAAESDISDRLVLKLIALGEGGSSLQTFSFSLVSVSSSQPLLVLFAATLTYNFQTYMSPIVFYISGPLLNESLPQALTAIYARLRFHKGSCKEIVKKASFPWRLQSW